MSKDIKTFEVTDFSFKYAGAEKQSIREINFSVKYGEFITLCGKTGSGKSTLLRNMKTVLAPHGYKDGIIKFYGRELGEVSSEEQARRIGFVLQDPENQIVTDKVWHELAFGLENLGVETNSIRTRVAEIATFFGISTWINKDISELSGGQKQLLNLAAVMVMNPDILILDEPTSALDPIATEEFIDSLIKINKNIGTTVIISEHDLGRVLSVSDRVIVMDKGKISVDDEPEKIGGSASAKDKDFLLSMPVPFRIYMGLTEDNGIYDKAPLTVRDGRNWLTKIFEGRHIFKAHLDEKKPEKINEDIKLKSVRFKYSKNGDDVIKNLDMETGKGKVTTIVGGNGSGKSTLLRIIAGILKPYQGKITSSSEKIILLPQNPQTLFTGDSVNEELLEVGQQAEIDDICSIMRLDDLRDRHAYDLSGGEQQRVALAKVLMVDGDVYLLDEPTTGQDGSSKKILGDIIRELSDKGKTIIIVTHDLEFAACYSDYCLLLFDGQIMSFGTPGQFFTNNTYYTTAGNRMSRHIFTNAVTPDDVISLCRENLDE